MRWNDLVLVFLSFAASLFCIAPSSGNGEIEGVVLAESFCADWDADSNIANQVLEELAREFESELLVLEYHIWDDRIDLYPQASQQENAERYNWYVPEPRERGIPDVFFNGLNRRIHKDAVEADQIRSEYLAAFYSELRRPTDVKLLQGMADVFPEKQTIEMGVSVCNYGDFTIPRLAITFIVYENLELITKDQGHGYVVRDVITEEPFEVSGNAVCYIVFDTSDVLPHVDFPNPFNPETWIPYQLKEGDEVRIRIYNIAGDLMRELELGYKPAGLYVSCDRAAYWDGRNTVGEKISSGVYFYSIQVGDFAAVRKLILLK